MQPRRRSDNLAPRLRLFRPKGRPKDLPWNAQGTLAHRAYPDYATYLKHQAGKLPTVDLRDYDTHYRQALVARLPAVASLHVLCLGARIGTEVRAFRDAGARAIGIDLNPGPKNRDVLHADFHRLPFRDDCFDAAFTNSLDHAFHLPRLAIDAARVVRPHGLFIVEAVRGTEEGKAPGHYESFSWQRIDDLAAALGALEWKLEERDPFDYPWGGEQLIFRNVRSSDAHLRGSRPQA